MGYRKESRARRAIFREAASELSALGHFPLYPSWRHKAQNSNGDSNCKLGFSRLIARVY